MPTYDYRCHACDAELEIFQSMKDKPKKKCPECGKLKLERLIGMGAGVIFRGGGFYETDYRSESYKKAAEADKSQSGKKPEKKDAGGSCACGQKTAKECASSSGTSGKAKKAAGSAD